MSASAEARLILKYFGTVSKTVSTVGQRAMTGAASGHASANASPVAKAVTGAAPVADREALLAFMRANPVTFYPAQMRMAM
ncbi:hypothetical protein ACKKBG_A27110 [Auxenochlorella protothecoides x Auxenochlorella symbiontica]|uniref:Uncharacterized protein n=1 Tax=Auxenochlorella protothecoides TaxID=3075 RepID=A0A087SGX1_AUXPR|nr:hypothetical protein F751_1854 [Auxenochlorella protothecoides]KFM24975.1 hypothetical protein F751_1854 [Auxenochlorella protothecoides]